MARTPEKLIVLALCLCGATLHAFAPPSPASAATIRRVNILGAGQNIEVEITANQPLNPTAQEVKNPERLVIDFPDALPAGELRNISVNRGEVKAVRVGLLTKTPPVTRVVIDLESSRHYQLFPWGKTRKSPSLPFSCSPPLPFSCSAPLLRKLSQPAWRAFSPLRISRQSQLFLMRRVQKELLHRHSPRPRSPSRKWMSNTPMAGSAFAPTARPICQRFSMRSIAALVRTFPFPQGRSRSR